MRITTGMSRSDLQAPLCAGLVLLVCCGCIGARGDIELIEARLRQQQDLADRYARELETVRNERDAARKEADLLRKQLADSGAQALPAEFTQSLFQVRGIEFNSLMTGGRDRDGKPGDDVIVALIVPKDEHGDLVKLPGTLELEALDLTRPEAERQVGKWSYSPQDCRTLWKSGAFSSGYQIEIPWTGEAGTDKLVLHARLSTADGRQFDATHTIKLKVPETASQRATASQPAAKSAGEVSPASGDVGRARLTNAQHEEQQSVTSQRVPRPTTEPLAREPLPPASPMPSADAFEPPADEQSAAPPANAAKPAPDGDDSGDTAPASAPRPFPEELQTSDVWTDATIPFLR